MPHVEIVHHNPEVVKEDVGFSEYSMVRLPAGAWPSLKVSLRASGDRRSCHRGSNQKVFKKLPRIKEKMH